MKKLIIIFTTCLLFINCGNPVKLSVEYWVNDQDDGLECYECDRSWKLKFLNESEFELWTYYGDKAQYQSCRSTGNYSYDIDSKTITILNFSSSNVMNCVNKFKGKWIYKESDFGLYAFFSSKNPSWKFQTYDK